MFILLHATAVERNTSEKVPKQINLRMRGHKSHIRYWKKHPRNPVAQHFSTKNLNEKEYTLEILNQEQDKNKRN